jgi:hypothetical protein
MLKVVDYLIEQERTRQAGGASTAAVQ